MYNRDYNNTFDEMFDFDHDGKIDFIEQYAEIDYLSDGKLTPGDGRTEFAHEYFMHSHDPNLSLPFALVDDDEEEEYEDEGYEGDD